MGQLAEAPLTRLAKALRAAFPELPPGPLRLVGTGFGSTVLEAPGGFIVRVARTAAAADGHAVEAAVLPALAPLVPVVVPIPVLYCRAGPHLPFGAIGYQKLNGEPAQAGTVTAATARELGAFLAVLHQVPAARFPALPGPDDVWQGWLRLRRDSGTVLRYRLAGGERQRLDRWWDSFLADPRLRQYRPAVRHGDLWYGNLLLRPGGALGAVLDWEAVAVADPAQDLALARYLGPSFAGSVLDAYRRHGGAAGGATRHRMDRHWELRELSGLPLAAAAGDEAETAECVAKLRAGPILG